MRVDSQVAGRELPTILHSGKVDGMPADETSSRSDAVNITLSDEAKQMMERVALRNRHRCNCLKFSLARQGMTGTLGRRSCQRSSRGRKIRRDSIKLI